MAGEEALKQAYAQLQRGDAESASRSCAGLLRAQPRHFDALHLGALAEARCGRMERALELFRRALAEQPEDLSVRANLALALRQAARWEELAELAGELLQVQPGQGRWRWLLAEAQLYAGQVRDAEASLRQLLVSEPGHAAARALLAQLLEQQRRDEEAMEQARIALRAEPPPFSAGLAAARILGRQGEHGEALALLDRMLETSSSPVNRGLALGTRGKLLDELDRTDEAFRDFTAANEAIAASDQVAAVRGTSVYSPESIAELERFFSPDRLRQGASANPPGDGEGPVFLVGFPRSGTTLMDRILAAHPEVAIIEEKPTLHEALARFARGPEGWQELASLDEAGLATYRRAYHEARSRFVSGKPGLVVDKLPLNIIFLGLIQRLFPDARVIVALRDPRDVCLSCFMQTFGINDAMSRFLGLDSTVDYYLRVMGLGLRLLEGLPLAALKLRYEDLVRDTRGEAARLLEFLGLPWNDAVLEFHHRATGRHIDTPSYDQVTRPVYDSAIGRWQRYRSHVETAFEPLERFVETLGYDRDVGT